jgi:hypothetical protein
VSKDQILQENKYSRIFFSEEVLVSITRLRQGAGGGRYILPGTRVYFSNPSLRVGNVLRKISIPSLSYSDYGNIFINNDYNLFKKFTITLVNKYGDTVVNNYPLTDLWLQSGFNSGYLRDFNIEIDLQRSYITLNENIGGVPLNKNEGFLLNFYTSY